MSTDTVPLLLNGQWTHPRAESFGPVYNPAAGEVIAEVPICGPAEVDAAVQAARAPPTQPQAPAPAARPTWMAKAKAAQARQGQAPEGRR